MEDGYGEQRISWQNGVKVSFHKDSREEMVRLRDNTERIERTGEP